ncbi:tagaturonate reductase [Adhaeribacter radiodurans]|uniref:tagaturonate reductase n=1 Tax=Adhaeribacter radiodurans TaxID=2745197 RepID=UPI001FEC68DE|nr:tagaturonate reductase [Adhaeribacter radiodurans]
MKKISASGNVVLPASEVWTLPEKVLQFGTGVLLRGLPDYFIDKANQQGVFNGRIVVVKSTDKGSTSEFDDQDGLYTLCVRGIADGQKIEENIICSAISRVLSANSDWSAILHVAISPDLQIIISNTTEVGILLVDDSVQAQPPVSFPGKLLAVLKARYEAFAGDPGKGLVIVPTELITDNGTKLKNIVTELARQSNLDTGFLQWLAQSNTFCNTLVDRIVPGKPEAKVLTDLEQKLGYQDDLLILSELYRLWAIEGDEHVKEVLSFSQVDEGVVIAPDITKYRELKLRLLNGTHTLSCALAFLAGQITVKEAMGQKAVSDFISRLMKEDIAPAIPDEVSSTESAVFSRQVLDRFRNPHLDHQWLSISLNYTAKLKLRVVPVIENYFKIFNQVPQNIALGFAAYLVFMIATETEAGKYYGSYNGERYLINDDAAGYFYDLWQQDTPEQVVEKALENSDLWGTNLAALPSFTAAIQSYLRLIMTDGILPLIKSLESEKVSV